MRVRSVAALAGTILLAVSHLAVADEARGFSIAPSSLLAVEQNRQAIVDGIMARWRDSITHAYGSHSAQKETNLRTTLMGLRADLLLSVSLSGGVEGISVATREPGAFITEGAVETISRINTKAIGN